MAARPPSPSAPVVNYNQAPQQTDLTPPSSPHSPARSDSVFGSRSPSPMLANGSKQKRKPEPSDLPAVRRQHITDGYRAGISAGKSQAETAQAGFDEGYPVGAMLGLKVGLVLGSLEERVKEARRNGDVAMAEDQLRCAERDVQLASLMDDMRQAKLLGKTAEEIEEDKEKGIFTSLEKWELPSNWYERLHSLRKWMQNLEQQRLEKT